MDYCGYYYGEIELTLIISVSLIVIIVPKFRTIYGLGVLLEDMGDDNNSASTTLFSRMESIVSP